VLLNGLREMDFGDFEGLAGEEIANSPSLRSACEQWKKGGREASCPNGESVAKLAERANGCTWRLTAASSWR